MSWLTHLLNQWRDSLDRVFRSLPDPPETATALPVAHLSTARYFQDIATDGELRTRHCKHFGIDLIYLFYGGIFYRPGKLATRNPAELPIAFLFHPLVLRANVRYFPFDTGAMENGLYGSEWTNRFRDYRNKLRINGKDEKTVCKLIYHLFQDNDRYKQGLPDPKCQNKPSPIPELYEFYEEDLTTIGVDHRQHCIECQFLQSIRFDIKLIWIGYPNTMDDVFNFELWPKLKPHMPEYYRYSYHRNFDPRDIASQLEERANDVINKYISLPHLSIK